MIYINIYFPGLIFAIWCISLRVVRSQSAYVQGLSRHKRQLIYPDGDPARVQLIIGLGIPVDLEEQAVTVGYVIKIQYHLPLNSTDYTDPIFNYASQVISRGIDGANGNTDMENSLMEVKSPQKSTEIQTRVLKDLKLNKDNISNADNEIHTENSDHSVHSENDLSGKSTVEEVTGAAGNDHVTNTTDDDVTSNYDDSDLNENNGGQKNVTLNEAIESEERNDAREENVRRKRSRWDLYKIIEIMAEHYGLSGRACLLKTICESADTPFTHRNGLLGELAHVLFTPSTTKEPLSHHTDNEYHAAEVIGKKNIDKCDVLFPDCQSSILEYFTQIDMAYLGKLY